MFDIVDLVDGCAPEVAHAFGGGGHGDVESRPDRRWRGPGCNRPPGRDRWWPPLRPSPAPTAAGNPPETVWAASEHRCPKAPPCPGVGGQTWIVMEPHHRDTVDIHALRQRRDQRAGRRLDTAVDHPRLECIRAGHHRLHDGRHQSAGAPPDLRHRTPDDVAYGSVPARRDQPQHADVDECEEHAFHDDPRQARQHRIVVRPDD